MALWAQRILNRSSVHSDPDVYFLLFTWMVEARVEWQMSIPVLTISVVVEGHHFYKTVWTSLTDEALQVY